MQSSHAYAYAILVSLLGLAACGRSTGASATGDGQAATTTTPPTPPPAPLPLDASDVWHYRVVDGWVGDQRDLTLGQDGNATLHETSNGTLGQPYDGTAVFSVEPASIASLSRSLEAVAAAKTNASYTGNASDCSDATITWRSGSATLTAFVACVPVLPQALGDAISGLNALLAQGQPLLPPRQ